MQRLRMRGNYLVELAADGLALASPSTASTDKIRVAGLDTSIGWTATTYEAAYVRYRNGYYYLFLSSGFCCAGLGSDYNVVVGRSTSPTGPYVDHMGRAMTGTSRGYPVVASSALFKGPGHNSLIEDANGDWWMLYHSYVVASPTGRRLLVDRLVWDDEGWPSVAGGVPSTHPFAVP